MGKGGYNGGSTIIRIWPRAAERARSAIAGLLQRHVGNPLRGQKTAEELFEIVNNKSASENHVELNIRESNNNKIDISKQINKKSKGRRYLEKLTGKRPMEVKVDIEIEHVKRRRIRKP